MKGALAGRHDQSGRGERHAARLLWSQRGHGRSPRAPALRRLVHDRAPRRFVPEHVRGGVVVLHEPWAHVRQGRRRMPALPGLRLACAVWANVPEQRPVPNARGQWRIVYLLRVPNHRPNPRFHHHHHHFPRPRPRLRPPPFPPSAPIAPPFSPGKWTQCIGFHQQWQAEAECENHPDGTCLVTDADSASHIDLNRRRMQTISTTYHEMNTHATCADAGYTSVGSTSAPPPRPRSGARGASSSGPTPTREASIRPSASSSRRPTTIRTLARSTLRPVARPPAMATRPTSTRASARKSRSRPRSTRTAGRRCIR